jgi:hypothetical protein
MKPTWMIQSNMEDVDTGPMIEQVLRQDMDVVCVKHRLGMEVKFDGYDPCACILCYGDIDFVRQVYHKASFVPGAWCNFQNMKCSTYYAYLGKYLLNQQYAMMPVGDLLRRWDDITSIVPGKSLFIRPDSGAKPFTGYVIAPAEKYKIQTLVTTVGPETLVVITTEKPITAEWRFVVCDRKIIAGCQYLPEESPHYPTTALCLATDICREEWQPDLCYTIDIAESEGKMYLLEINGFSCAGFYQCNIGSIIGNASRIASEEWKEYYVPNVRSDS